MDTNFLRVDPDTRNVRLLIQQFILLLRVVAAMLHIFREVGRLRPQIERTYELDFDKSRKLIHEVVYKCDEDCYKMFRMNRKRFMKLRDMLYAHGKLRDARCVLVDEQLAITLHILGHNVRNRVISKWFRRSGDTVSKVFRSTIRAIIRLQRLFLNHPKPIGLESTDIRWSFFQGCLGAIDGTFVPIRVRNYMKPRFRNRKGHTTMNVMCACTKDKLITYILPGWEGSAADGRVLRDAVSRRNGLQVNRGTYYLVDAGYTNSEGFLAPYRGQRYHLGEWSSGSRAPQTPEEIFNMRHAKARNVIECCFGLLKQRWAVLRSPCFYDVKMTTFIIIACAVLHNYLMAEAPDDLLDSLIPKGQELGVDDDASNDQPKRISTVGPTDAWTTFRNNLATSMFDDYRLHHH